MPLQADSSTVAPASQRQESACWCGSTRSRRCSAAAGLAADETSRGRGEAGDSTGGTSQQRRRAQQASERTPYCTSDVPVAVAQPSGDCALDCSAALTGTFLNRRQSSRNTAHTVDAPASARPSVRATERGQRGSVDHVIVGSARSAVPWLDPRSLGRSDPARDVQRRRSRPTRERTRSDGRATATRRESASAACADATGGKPRSIVNELLESDRISLQTIHWRHDLDGLSESGRRAARSRGNESSHP
jgi:hypothetical protein